MDVMAIGCPHSGQGRRKLGKRDGAMSLHCMELFPVHCSRFWTGCDIPNGIPLGGAGRILLRLSVELHQKAQECARQGLRHVVLRPEGIADPGSDGLVAEAVREIVGSLKRAHGPNPGLDCALRSMAVPHDAVATVGQFQVFHWATKASASAISTRASIRLAPSRATYRYRITAKGLHTAAEDKIGRPDQTTPAPHLQATP
jgi:hypothetical protein